MFWELRDGGMGMVAGPEAELVLQRGGVLRRGIFFQPVSPFCSYEARDADLDLVCGSGHRGS